MWANATGSKLYPAPGLIPLSDAIVPIVKFANVNALYNISKYLNGEKYYLNFYSQK